MPSMRLDRGQVVIGVDTHKDQHVAVAIDGLRGRLGEFVIPVNVGGYEKLLAWARCQGQIVAFGIEGTGSYGIGLTRFLRRHGVLVREVCRPPRSAERRARGKSDSVDAENAARQVLAGEADAIPKITSGDLEVIRLIKIARDTAVKARSQALITLKATLVTASDELRAELEPLADSRLISACSSFGIEGDAVGAGAAMRYTLGVLSRRWLHLDAEIRVHTKHLKRRTKDVAPDLVNAFGIGFDTASELLLAAGGDATRIRSESAFAKLCGACPIPASSGRTTGRHRLNRGGNRQANAALYRIVIVRMRWHQPTLAYVRRRTEEGLSKRDIIRCLKRYVAREAYRLLPQVAAEPADQRRAA